MLQAAPFPEYVPIRTLLCVPVLVLKFILGVSVCVQEPLRLLLDTACLVVMLKRPPPLPPAPTPPGRRLTLAGPDRELAWRGIHRAPRQPTEPTHWANPLSLCRCTDAWTNTRTHIHTQTHAHTCMHACIATRPGEAPWASRCPNAPFLCVTFLLDVSWSLFYCSFQLFPTAASNFFFHFLFVCRSRTASLAFTVLTALSLLIASVHSEYKIIETQITSLLPQTTECHRLGIY